MTSDDGGCETVDPTVVRRVLREHPIRIGILFGSHVRGTETTESDVDVAVEFEDSLSDEERHRARIDLIVDLMEAIGVNDVDVTDLEDVRPAIGAAALRTGVALVGEEARIDRLREEFASQTIDRSHEQRMREFDELLDRLEEAV